MYYIFKRTKHHMEEIDQQFVAVYGEFIMNKSIL